MKKKIIMLPETSFRLSPRECEVYWNDFSDYSYACSIILPTCSSTIFYRYFFPMIGSLKDMAMFSTLCLNLQGEGFDLEEITEKCKDMGLSYRICFNKYDVSEGCSINRIVDDTCMIAPKNTQMFLRVDDDFIFAFRHRFSKRSSGWYYLTAIHYMLTHPNCGTIATNLTSKTPQEKGVIGPVYTEYGEDWAPQDPKEYRNVDKYKDFCWTCRGLFFRNLHPKKDKFGIAGRSLAKEIVDKDWYYDGEDVISALIRMSYGYYIARAHFGLIEHFCQYSGHKEETGDPRKWGQLWDQTEYGDWIRKNLNKDYDRVHHSQYICDPEIFKENYKGIDLSLEENCKKETVDYNELSLETISSEIVEELKNLSV